MKITTEDILAVLEDEDKVQEFAGVIVLTLVNVATRRALRKTLVLHGIEPKLAKRYVSALANATTVVTLSVLTAKRIHGQAYPE